MNYSISEVAKISGISKFTLRYYDKMGILSFIDRNSKGIRTFKESDLNWITMITCLKESGMPLKDIKQFIDWSFEGDSTLNNRLDTFIEHKQNVLDQIKLLEKHLKKIDHKINYYKTAINAGTEEIHKNTKCIIRELDLED